MNDKMIEYKPPKDTGVKDRSRYWNKTLSKYKTKKHDKNWVYMYAFDECKTLYTSIIYDRFPKARFHLLLLPTFIDVNSPKDFRKYHLSELKNIHQLAKKVANDLRNYYGAKFMVGYHAKPSMVDLHLHIISTDLVSPYMKKKDHYVSFTNPDYFLTIDRVENDLKKYGKVNIDENINKKISSSLLKCHKCNSEFNSFSVLKEHLIKHI